MTKKRPGSPAGLEFDHRITLVRAQEIDRCALSLQS